ncbi:GCN5 N-acetyltransferase [Trematosphaeria pertusa]|uniref:GCN5 N-acetyltransferase n=1 Tax=Trematosphaeria pertusa TaxID=390896 RepID=A0A6A6IHW9_9PLEO|nr:GCN5 N-acetyltransferase [Trematosphaeria pertusa]KAF2249638.1 GCN5 N-acetyltransferase [Trematosphaeria pertusa]
MKDSPGNTAPNRNSTLTFREVTKDNWRAVTKLSLKDGQVGNLASNLFSLCQAHYSEDAWVRAIYADETLVGFLMMGIWDPEESYTIWRFMIDARYQNLGYGRRGVEFAIAHVRQHNPRAKQLKLYTTPPEGKKSQDPIENVKPEDSPYKFYQKLGFREIAPPDEDGETLMALEL